MTRLLHPSNFHGVTKTFNATTTSKRSTSRKGSKLPNQFHPCIQGASWGIMYDYLTFKLWYRLRISLAPDSELRTRTHNTVVGVRINTENELSVRGEFGFSTLEWTKVNQWIIYTWKRHALGQVLETLLRTFPQFTLDGFPDASCVL